MSLADLQLGNSKRARSTAVKALLRFLQPENANIEYVKGCIQRDESRQCFVFVMDKFGMHFAFHDGRSGKPLARHSCMQYCRQALVDISVMIYQPMLVGSTAAACYTRLTATQNGMNTRELLWQE